MLIFCVCSNLLEESIRVIGIKDLIRSHDVHKILHLGQIYDIMDIAGQHVNSLNAITTHLKLDKFISTDLAFLNEVMSSNNDEEFPLAVVPMLPLCDSRL